MIEIEAITHAYPFSIKEHHLDIFGHVNNANYLTILEEARWDFVKQRGYGLNNVRESQKGPVVLEIKIQFLRELALGSELRIESQLLSYENRTGWIRQEIKLEDGSVASRAEIRVGLFDMKLRRLIEPTPEWAHAIGMKLKGST